MAAFGALTQPHRVRVGAGPAGPPQSLPAGCFSHFDQQGAAEPVLSSSSAAEAARWHRLPDLRSWKNPGPNLGGFGLARLAAHILAEQAPWALGPDATTFFPSMMGESLTPDLQEYQIQGVPLGSSLVRGPTLFKDQDPCPENRLCFGIFKIFLRDFPI